MNLKAVLEGLLFVVGDEGISKEKLLNVLDVSEEEFQKILDDYASDLSKDDRGLNLEKYNDNYKLVTKKEHSEYYKKLVSSAKKFNAQITYKDKNEGWFNPEILKIVLDDILSENF